MTDVGGHQRGGVAGGDVLGPPPGPSGPPEVQARLWLEHPVQMLESSRRTHGDIFALTLGGFGTIVIIADPAAVREVFAFPPERFECRHFNESYRYAMGDHALFLQDGDRHRRLKKILAPLFREAALAGHERVVAEETRAALGRAQGTGEVTLRPMTHEITLGALMRLALGERAEARERIMDMFRERVWRDLRSWKPWTMMSRQRPKVLEVLAGELAVRRAAPEAHDDLLARLVRARDDDGQGLADDEIMDQITMLTITAGDAVAVACGWALDRLARNPRVAARLAAEREGAGGATGVEARPYLHAAAKEVVRLHPILPTVSGRRLVEDLDFRGYRIEAGATLAPCEYLVHRRADLFDEPLEFRPERFIGRSYPLHHYFPFGGAQRACLGAALAPLTIRGVLDTAAEVAAFEPADPEPTKPVRHGTLIAPHETLALRLRTPSEPEVIHA